MYQCREKLRSARKDFIKRRMFSLFLLANFGLEIDISPQRYCFFTVSTQSPLLRATAIFLQETKCTLLCPVLSQQGSCWNTPLLPPSAHPGFLKKNRAAGGKREMLLPNRYLGCGQGTCPLPSEV